MAQYSMQALIAVVFNVCITYWMLVWYKRLSYCRLRA